MHLDKLITFKGRQGPILLVVADGVGLAESGPANALSLAHTPNIDRLLASPLSTRLHAHGTHVGLPTDTDMGNSEVGHNTLGGGRIFDQGAKLVKAAFNNGSLFESETWRKIESRGLAGQTVHFLGLLSDGNVHSHIDHLIQLLQRCHESGIQSACVHVLLDGRDVDPRSAPIYLNQLQIVLNEINDSGDRSYRIASGGGRMVITMDRYNADWEMVKNGYDIHVLGKTTALGSEVADALDEVNRQYACDPELTDQYLAPFVVVGNNGPVGCIQDGDGVVLFNFRGDRAIEISQALGDPDFSCFERDAFPDIYFCGLLQYDGDLEVPRNYLVNPPAIDGTMMEYLCAENLHTFAISETQKFGHVTYFWNGNKSGFIDQALETYIEIPSDNCTFDHAPKMKAIEITDATIECLDSRKYRFGRINFANGDMVGHTGNIPATVLALECVDRCIGRLMDCIDDHQGALIFTADHGNADEMFVTKNGVRIPRTSHSLNPVPFVVYDSQCNNDYELNPAVDGGLANVAATVFNLLGYRPPHDYAPSLISIFEEPNRTTLYKGRIVDLGLETTVLPNGELLAMEIVRHPGGAVVVAMDEKENLCVIKQFRHAANGWIWEFPAGILDPNEPADETAIRELKEETGYTARRWDALGSTLTSPGFCDERLHVFLARDLITGKTNHEPHEFIESHWKSMTDVTDMIASGEMVDAKSIVALFRVHQHLREENI